MPHLVSLLLPVCEQTMNVAKLVASGAGSLARAVAGPRVRFAEVEQFGALVGVVDIALEKAAKQRGGHRSAKKDADRHNHNQQDDHDHGTAHGCSLPSRAGPAHSRARH